MSAFDTELDYSTMASMSLSPWGLLLLPSPNRHRHTSLVPGKELQKALNALCSRDAFTFLLLPVSLRLFKLRLKSLGWPAEHLQEIQKAHSHLMGFFPPGLIAKKDLHCTLSQVVPLSL